MPSSGRARKDISSFFSTGAKRAIRRQTNIRVVLAIALTIDSFWQRSIMYVPKNNANVRRRMLDIYPVISSIQRMRSICVTIY